MIDDLNKLIRDNNSINNSIFIKMPIDEYVLKLSKFATVIPYYSNSILKGFIAYYSNDSLKNAAYLSMLIIDKSEQGKGLGRLLVQSSINDLINKGFSNYKLEVLKQNKRAIHLYSSFNFIIEEDRGDLWLMNLNLN